jgi:hypothetical protein
MTNIYEPVSNEDYAVIYKRANRKCECNHPACEHPGGLCGLPLDKDADVYLPPNTPKSQHVAKGRMSCQACCHRNGTVERRAIEQMVR